MAFQGNSGFLKMLQEAIGADNASLAAGALGQDASVSIRLNPSRIPEGMDPKVFASHVFGTEVAPVPWSGYGFMLARRPNFTLDPYFHAGTYYVQDSSAMFVGEVFRRCVDLTGKKSLKVLDLCAAPGGKTTDLAASLRDRCGDGFILVANEVMKQRAAVLADNVGIWGDPNVVVTSCDPKAFASMEGFFDIIVADVPCSGEGMFRKDEEAVRQWSEENVALCESRQRRIVADVWPALAPGGLMVYSTCTFNKKENDGNMKWIAESLDAEVIDIEAPFEGLLKMECGYSLVPGLVKGEGQYCGALKKNGEQASLRPAKPAAGAVDVPSLKNLFCERVTFRQRSDMLIAVPQAVERFSGHLQPLRPILSGVACGVMKGKDLVPDADLAHSYILAEGNFKRVDVPKETALAFLHKDTIVLSGEDRGLLVICYDGQPLGFVKNLGNRCNNLHPQGRRIRMEIKV